MNEHDDDSGSRFLAYVLVGVCCAGLGVVGGLGIAAVTHDPTEVNQLREDVARERELKKILQEQVASLTEQVRSLPIQSTTNSDEVEATAFRPSDSISLDGRDWVLAGPCPYTGDIRISGMDSVYYTTKEPDIRLIVMTPAKSSLANDSRFGYAFVSSVQIERDGSWSSHGRRIEIMQDGQRRELYFMLGEAHGLQRDWFSNGQLHVEIEHAFDKKNGRARAWYESGKPEYDLIFVNDEEISGKAWREDGTLRQ